MKETSPTNLYADTSFALKEGRAALIDDLLAGKAPRFLDDNAHLIDDYFRQSYEKVSWGQRWISPKIHMR